MNMVLKNIEINNTDLLKILQAVSEVAIIAYTDQNGRITYANKNFCEISGYSMDELSGKDHRLLNSYYHNEDFFKDMYRIVKNGKVWRGEIRNKKKNGSFYWVDTQIIPIYNSEGIIESYASIRFDISERKKNEQNLLEIEKLTSIGLMAKAVAHELNNPLTIIELCCHGLNRELNEGLPSLAIRKKILKISNQSKRIALIVKELKYYNITKDIKDLAG